MNTAPFFQTYEAAYKWAMINGKDNCLPCHKWMIVVDEAHDRKEFRVAVLYRASGKFVGYAE
jgi:hypothetical protein